MEPIDLSVTVNVKTTGLSIFVSEIFVVSLGQHSNY